jgi:hypothetical protein
MQQGLKNLQESATYKRTAENLQFAKVRQPTLANTILQLTNPI